jgi:glycosyltransferase involved in cell wall biosynthesis
LKNKTLLFYSDADTVGGHEIQTIRMVNTLADSYGANVHFAYFSEGITPHLSDKTTTSRLPFHWKTPGLYHQRSWDFSLVKQLILRIKPDLVIISQGCIESGVRGIIGAKMAGATTVSYLPFGNTNKELGNRFSLLRDTFSTFIFPLFNFYITISKYQARMLDRLTKGQETFVINNPGTGTDSTPRKPSDINCPTVREPLNIGVIGRILFKQKNQNRLVPVAERLAAMEFPVHFHIVGDGPDRPRLEAMIFESSLQHMFTFYSWLNADEIVNLLQNTVDVTLLPSHYEGLPLVMLESIHQGTPVIVSNMPFIADYDIPECYIVKADSTDSICEKIVGICKIDNMENITRIQKNIEETNSYARFNQDIYDCFDSILGSANSSA